MCWHVLTWKKESLLSVIFGPQSVGLYEFSFWRLKRFCALKLLFLSHFEIHCQWLQDGAHVSTWYEREGNPNTSSNWRNLLFSSYGEPRGLTRSFYICRRKHLFESSVVRLFLRSTFVSHQSQYIKDNCILPLTSRSLQRSSGFIVPSVWSLVLNVHDNFGKAGTFEKVQRKFSSISRGLETWWLEKLFILNIGDWFQAKLTSVALHI